MEFVLAGEISPKLIVTTRSLRTLELPETEPPSPPLIVGVPPLLISNVCASAVANAQRSITKENMPMVERRAILASRGGNGKRYRDSSASVFVELWLNRENRRHRKTVRICFRNRVHDEGAIQRSRRRRKRA